MTYFQYVGCVVIKWVGGGGGGVEVEWGLIYVKLFVVVFGEMVSVLMYI